MCSLICFVYYYLLITESKADEFTEKMLLRALPDGSLFVELRFDIIADYKKVLFYELFPKSIYELFIRLPSLWQFDLALTRGRWDYEHWRYENISPLGAELSAIFYNNTESSDSDWLIFQQIISGLYCASMNEINIQIVNNTKYHFVPSQLEWLNDLSNGDWISYFGIAPKENICTENITPFSNLLPCRLNYGLSLFLNPSNLFSAHYQSMQVHVTPVLEFGKEYMRMTQLFQLVIANPNANANQIKKHDIKQLFGVDIKLMLTGCPVADSSFIEFDGFNNNAIFDSSQFNNLSFEWPTKRKRKQSGNYLKTERFLAEDDLLFGSLMIAITNTHPNHTIRFSYFEPLPHFLRFYFYSMDIRIDGISIDPSEFEYFAIEFPTYESLISSSDVVRIRNENPICLEWVVSLKPNSELVFRIDIEKEFEHFESYPPDYNRGFDVPNGIVKILSTNDIYYTSQILILLPYPDMSMVFNVIAFSSTLFAFFFGTAFNNIYRDIEDLDKRNVHLITDKVKKFFTKMLQKFKKLFNNR
eukprot:117218_1